MTEANRREKIRILHIIQSKGGVQRYIRSFLKYIDHNKFYNIIVCSQDYKSDDYVDLADEFETVTMVRDIDIKADISAIFTIRKLIKKYHSDILYCHSSKAGAIGRIAALGMKNKCIYNPHGWAFNMNCSNKKKKLYAIIERMLARMTDRIVCISKAEQESALDKRICKKEKTVVIYNGIDFEEYENSQGELTRETAGIKKNAFVVGFVGRLSEQKSPDIFAKTAVLIKHKIPNAFFLMVGDGELRSEVEKIFKDNGMEQSYLITGWVNNPMTFIQLFDIATLLSRWEGFGLVLAEYMLAGKPIVASDVDAIPNIIENEINGLVSELNEEEISENVFSLYRDSSLREKLCSNGKKIVRERYDVRRVVAEHTELFIETLNFTHKAQYGVGGKKD